MDGFEQGEIGVGVVTGIRRWALHSGGWLHGLSYAERWMQGENVAVHGGTLPAGAKADRFAFTLTPHRGRKPAPPPCVDLACGQCGYYAYFNERAAYGSGQVTGIIEGYGHVIIGTRGFRAQRARIVAVCPESVNGMDFLAFTRNYPDVLTYRTEEEMLAAHPTDKVEEPIVDPFDMWRSAWTFGQFPTFTITIDQPWPGDASYSNGAKDETPKTPRERALEARRNRSTGPAKSRLDGRPA